MLGPVGEGELDVGPGDGFGSTVHLAEVEPAVRRQVGRCRHDDVVATGGTGWVVEPGSSELPIANSVDDVAAVITVELTGQSPG